MSANDEAEILRLDIQGGESGPDQIIHVFCTSSIQKQNGLFSAQNRKVDRTHTDLSFQKEDIIK
jgi:hypothetical protein